MERYADACVLELQRAVGAADLAAATSVFFGGGTPSRLHPDTLCRVLDAIPRAPGAEVTVECNPEDADAAHLGAYRRAGVTRVSFGLQSTHDHVLAGLGRRARAARRRDDRPPRWRRPASPPGTSTSSSAPPAESDDDWARTLEQVLALDAPAAARQRLRA